MTSLGPSLPMEVALFCTHLGSALKLTMLQAIAQQTSKAMSSDTNSSSRKTSEVKTRNTSQGSAEGKKHQKTATGQILRVLIK